MPGHPSRLRVGHLGFTASLPDNISTRFDLDGSPDPAHCSATYHEAPTPDTGGVVTVDTGGC